MLEVPAADLHIALVLIQALGEGLCICFAATWAPGAALVGIVIGLAGNSTVCLLLLRWGARSAPEHASNGVAD